MKDPKLLRRWIERSKKKGSSLLRKERWTKMGDVLRRAPARFQGRSLRDLKIENVPLYERWFRLALLVVAVFVLSEITGRVIAIFIRPIPMEVPQKPVAEPTPRNKSTESFDTILSRNIFNVEGTIPDPLDQGRMDCFSQAKPTSQRLSLLGTIVMTDEQFSVALVQEDGNSVKYAVKKDDLFGDSKFQALKVDRKRLCFQVKETSDFEFVEIPDDSTRLGFSAQVVGGARSDGITPVGENQYAVNKQFLDKQLLNLTEILQTAKAVPYIDPSSGKFRGFLVQTIDPSSPFMALGVRQGDILTGVNEIVLDNAGKGLEAFQRLRNSSEVNLKVIRGGQEQSINYKVN